MLARPPPFSIFFEVVIFGGIFVDFGFAFGAPLAPFGLILVPFWLKLGPFWHPLGSFWCPFGSNWVPFGAMSGQILVILHPRGFVLARFGRNSSFKAVFCKKIHLHWPWHQICCKFFACKLSSLGPGAELLPQATEIDQKAFTLHFGRKGWHQGAKKATHRNYNPKFGPKKR